MRIERWEPGDGAAVRECHRAWLAAKEADDPLGSPKSAHVLGAWLKHSFMGQPGEVWLAREGPGDDLVGWCRIGLPDRDNRHVASVHMIVPPERRRRGVGTGLLRHAERRAAAEGRTRLNGEVREGSVGEAFAAAHGAVRDIVEVRRVLDLTAVPGDRWRELRAGAEPKAAGYTLASWTGSTPAEYADTIAAAHEAMNDAPHLPGFEPEAWDARRVREDDAMLATFGFRSYSIAAVRGAGGEVAALTQVFVDPEIPAWGHQGVTAVARAHRGHRLGLLVKTAMLQWLADTEPALERIDTGNAGTNRHMIAINETLGFRVYGPGWARYQKIISSERSAATV